MKITDTAIRFRSSVLVFAALLVVVGIWSYATIPKEATPSFEIPLITVTTIYPGASPREIETLITFPIEREIQGVDGIEEIRSTSSEGVSFILVEFATGISLAEANRRVREQVDIARAEIPGDAEEPRVREIDIEDFPVITVNLSGPYSVVQLKRTAERLQDEIEGIAGVLEAELTGGIDREVQVEVDLLALQGYELTFEEVAEAIERENVSIPGGTIEADRLAFQVRVDGRLEDARRIEELVIAAPGGRPVYVRDVATVIPDGFVERTSYARLRELRREDERGRLVPVSDAEYRETVSLGVRTRTGENILEMVEAVRGVIDEFPFPTGTEVVLTGDRSETVAEFVEELENHIIFGVLLVTLSLLFFLGLRTALLAAISIPLTMFLAFAIFRAVDQTLNFIILFSLIIVLGILVDFAIIVVENIQRYQERGYESWEGVRAATQEVAWPVTAGLATSAAVFAPLLFWGGTTGEFLRYIPITLIVTLTSALFVALIMIPVIAGYALGGLNGEGRVRTRAPRYLGFGVLVFVALVLLLANPVTLLVLVLSAAALFVLYRFLLAPGTVWFQGRALPAAERRYRGFLAWALARDYGRRRAYLRNVAALGAFTTGALLLIVGGAILVVAGRLPALVALVPGAVLAGLGLLGILLHFLETLLLGGRVTMYVGVALALTLLPISLVQFARGELGAGVLLVLLTPAAVLILIGLLGARLLRRIPGLILTDNRARVLCTAIGSLVAVLVLFAAAPTGTAFFPDTDPNQILISVEAPVGTTLEASDRTATRAVERIEALIARDPRVEANIQNIAVNVGVAAEGAFLRGEPSPRRSSITLNLVDFAHRAESSSETLRKLREALDGFPGAIIDLDQDRPGPPVEPPVQIEISGPDFDRVAEISVEVEDRLRRAAGGEIPGLVDVRNSLERGQPEARVRIDRERAAIAGVPTAAIATTVRAAVEGRLAGSIREEEDEFDVRVRLREIDRASLEALETLRIGGPDAQVPLVSVARVETGTGVGAITRLDLSPVVTVEADAAPGFGSGEVLSRVQASLDDLRGDLPAGYTLRYRGEAEEQQEEFAFLGVALLLGLGLILLVLVTKFNSLPIALMILIAIGITMSGVVLGLIATRTAFGLFTFLGVISLAGIVADDDIVLTEFILRKREEGLSRTEAILEGGTARFRQVTLTAVTTIVGLVPLTVGLYVDFSGLLTEFRPDVRFGGQNTQFWGPLGTAIIAGLPAATVVTLLIVPVMYSVFDSLGRHGARVFGREEGERGSAPRSPG